MRSAGSAGHVEHRDLQEVYASTSQADKKHVGAFNFAFNFWESAESFAVRGKKRCGLIIDPGVASGLIGSDTLKDIMDKCIHPYGKFKDAEMNKVVTSPVSGISGGSDRTLGQVKLPLIAGGCPITYTAEVIGGEGSCCPALVGNPTLRKMNSTIFTNYFQNGDGLLVLDSRSDDGESLQIMNIFLTDSGHYLLPCDANAKSGNNLDKETKDKVAVFWNQVASRSAQQWSDVNPRILYIFAATMDHRLDAEGDRSDSLHAEGALYKLIVDKNNKTVRFDTDNIETILVEEHDQEADKEDKQHGAEGILPSEGTPLVSEEEPHDKHNDNLCFNHDGEPCDEFDTLHDEKFHYMEEDFPKYSEDIFPEGADHSKLSKKYKAIPEEYYSRTGFRPVTPKNFSTWFASAKGRGLRWHFWELFSGSGRLSLILLLAGLTVGFPMDMRYGWDLNNVNHQQMIKKAQVEFQPGVMFMVRSVAHGLCPHPRRTRTSELLNNFEMGLPFTSPTTAARNNLDTDEAMWWSNLLATLCFIRNNRRYDWTLSMTTVPSRESINTCMKLKMNKDYQFRRQQHWRPTSSSARPLSDVQDIRGRSTLIFRGRPVALTGPLLQPSTPRRCTSASSWMFWPSYIDDNC